MSKQNDEIIRLFMRLNQLNANFCHVRKPAIGEFKIGSLVVNVTALSVTDSKALLQVTQAHILSLSSWDCGVNNALDAVEVKAPGEMPILQRGNGNMAIALVRAYVAAMEAIK